MVAIVAGSKVVVEVICFWSDSGRGIVYGNLENANGSYLKGLVLAMDVALAVGDNR